MNKKRKDRTKIVRIWSKTIEIEYSDTIKKYCRQQIKYRSLTNKTTESEWKSKEKQRKLNKT